MKTLIVPAQITSVEDKIAGNLSFTQLLLMIVPVFISAGLFVFLPPFTQFRVYKLAIASVIAIISIALSIRIKSRLILEWLPVLGRYNLRPRYYVFNKNHTQGRDITVAAKKKEIVDQKKQLAKPIKHLSFHPKEVYAFESAIVHPGADLHFKRNKKGGLDVRIKQV